MTIYLYLRSGKKYELVPQIRLTCSKNGITGTIVLEVGLDDNPFINSISDPIYGIGLQKKSSLRMADICHFVWSSGKPIKLSAIFILSKLDEKQDFFNFCPDYALNHRLEFFPSQLQQ